MRHATNKHFVGLLHVCSTSPSTPWTSHRHIVRDSNLGVHLQQRRPCPPMPHSLNHVPQHASTIPHALVPASLLDQTPSQHHASTAPCPFTTSRLYCTTPLHNITPLHDTILSHCTTLTDFPSTTWPCSSLSRRTWSTDSRCLKVRKPKPRRRLVMGSTFTDVSTISPYFSK